MEFTEIHRPIVIKDEVDAIDDIIELDCDDNDNDNDKSPEEIANEWHEKVRKRLNQTLFPKDEKVFMNSLQWYLNEIKVITGDLEDTSSFENVLLRQIKIIEVSYKRLKKCYVVCDQTFLEIMEEILTYYINIVMENITKKKKTMQKSVYKKAKAQICRRFKCLLLSCLLENQQSILHVLMTIQIQPQQVTYEDVVSHCYSYFLTREKQEKTEDNYCRCYIIIEKWKTVRKPEEAEVLDKCLFTMFNIESEEEKQMFRAAIDKILRPSENDLKGMLRNYFNHIKTSTVYHNIGHIDLSSPVSFDSDIEWDTLSNDSSHATFDNWRIELEKASREVETIDLERPLEPIAIKQDNDSDDDCVFVSNSFANVSPGKIIIKRELCDDDDIQEIWYPVKDTTQPTRHLGSRKPKNTQKASCSNTSNSFITKDVTTLTSSNESTTPSNLRAISPIIVDKISNTSKDKTEMESLKTNHCSQQSSIEKAINPNFADISIQCESGFVVDKGKLEKGTNLDQPESLEVLSKSDLEGTIVSKSGINSNNSKESSNNVKIFSMNSIGTNTEFDKPESIKNAVNTNSNNTNIDCTGIANSVEDTIYCTTNNVVDLASPIVSKSGTIGNYSEEASNNVTIFSTNSVGTNTEFDDPEVAKSNLPNAVVTNSNDTSTVPVVFNNNMANDVDANIDSIRNSTVSSTSNDFDGPKSMEVSQPESVSDKTIESNVPFKLAVEKEIQLNESDKDKSVGICAEENKKTAQEVLDSSDTQILDPTEASRELVIAKVKKIKKLPANPLVLFLEMEESGDLLKFLAEKERRASKSKKIANLVEEIEVDDQPVNPFFSILTPPSDENDGHEGGAIRTDVQHDTPTNELAHCYSSFTLTEQDIEMGNQAACQYGTISQQPNTNFQQVVVPQMVPNPVIGTEVAANVLFTTTEDYFDIGRFDIIMEGTQQNTSLSQPIEKSISDTAVEYSCITDKFRNINICSQIHSNESCENNNTTVKKDNPVLYSSTPIKVVSQDFTNDNSVQPNANAIILPVQASLGEFSSVEVTNSKTIKSDVSTDASRNQNTSNGKGVDQETKIHRKIAYTTSEKVSGYIRYDLPNTEENQDLEDIWSGLLNINQSVVENPDNNFDLFESLNLKRIDDQTEEKLRVAQIDQEKLGGVLTKNSLKKVISPENLTEKELELSVRPTNDKTNLTNLNSKEDSFEKYSPVKRIKISVNKNLQNDTNLVNNKNVLVGRDNVVRLSGHAQESMHDKAVHSNLGSSSSALSAERYEYSNDHPPSSPEIDSPAYEPLTKERLLGFTTRKPCYRAERNCNSSLQVHKKRKTVHFKPGDEIIPDVINTCIDRKKVKISLKSLQESNCSPRDNKLVSGLDCWKVENVVISKEVIDRWLKVSSLTRRKSLGNARNFCLLKDGEVYKEETIPIVECNSNVEEKYKTNGVYLNLELAGLNLATNMSDILIPPLPPISSAFSGHLFESFESTSQISLVENSKPNFDNYLSIPSPMFENSDDESGSPIMVPEGPLSPSSIDGNGEETMEEIAGSIAIPKEFSINNKSDNTDIDILTHTNQLNYHSESNSSFFNFNVDNFKPKSTKRSCPSPFSFDSCKSLIENFSESDPEDNSFKSSTKLPLKKRKMSISPDEDSKLTEELLEEKLKEMSKQRIKLMEEEVKNNRLEEEKKVKQELSYPATPMLSIAALELGGKAKPFKTAAERKNYDVDTAADCPPNSQPQTSIVTEQYNNHTYNNATINYHMNAPIAHTASFPNQTIQFSHTIPVLYGFSPLVATFTTT